MTNQPNSPEPNQVPDNPDNGRATPQESSQTATQSAIPTPLTQGEQHLSTLPRNQYVPRPSALEMLEADPSTGWIILTALAIMGVGILVNNTWVGLSGAIAALLISLRVIYPAIQNWLTGFLTRRGFTKLIGFLGFLIAIAGLLKFVGVYRAISNRLAQIQWDEFGSWAEWVGALGQILIAILAVYVAWRQYVISKDLTIQQNLITQQQTIDAYFQGISDLTLSEEGLLEDWPQERAIAEGRTAAILSSVDATGKAKIIRFLSQSKFLTPLMRDQRLGRAILNGSGGYMEDRRYGVRVIDLGVMLAGANLSGTDLRWTDLSEANLVRANLSRCDLVKTNLARTILYEATLVGADLRAVRLFYGSVETASPRSRTIPPNYETGEHTGAVIEKANFTGVQRMSEEQRYYCCAWGGERTRDTIPGGCEGIPNKLGR